MHCKMFVYVNCCFFVFCTAASSSSALQDLSLFCIADVDAVVGPAVGKGILGTTSCDTYANISAAPASRGVGPAKYTCLQDPTSIQLGRAQGLCDDEAASVAEWEVNKLLSLACDEETNLEINCEQASIDTQQAMGMDLLADVLGITSEQASIDTQRALGMDLHKGIGGDFSLARIHVAFVYVLYCMFQYRHDGQN